MKHSRILTGGPTDTIFVRTTNLGPNLKRVCDLRRPSVVRFPVTISTGSRPGAPSPVRSSSPTVAPETESGPVRGLPGKLQDFEEMIEKAIYGCRFLAIFAVWGSLVGSFLCFIKGCTYVVASYQQYFENRAKVIFWLVESIDFYLLGTVMLVFGMGLYELFISNLDIAKVQSEEKFAHRSNLFGLFTLKERPEWLEVKSINELKTKLGHVIVMLLLIGLFDKSKKAAIHTPVDLLCFSASVLLCSGCLYLLSKLNGSD
ncbi:hypothetical protein RHGRI_031267 [Rhododendron griersonianum]|uniref:Uncharacterized protein n=1 Tax=Rhododendron griersonianum TaxID=479676 RepID=A0AAV6I776_9ERIC|nr:hypothetical protein RHGRI_031267 [Rhododendron griersonianum]